MCAGAQALHYACSQARQYSGVHVHICVCALAHMRVTTQAHRRASRADSIIYAHVHTYHISNSFAKNICFRRDIISVQTTFAILMRAGF